MSCPPKYGMSPGNVLKATVTFQNTGTQSHAFDVYVAFGWGTTLEEFLNNLIKNKIGAGNMVEAPSASPGETVSVDVPIGPIGSEYAGTWDILVMVGDYIPPPPGQETGEFKYADWLICPSVLIIG